MDIVVKDSKIKGKGVFAARDFKKGETVIVWHPKRTISKEEMSSLTEDDQNHSTYAGMASTILWVLLKDLSIIRVIQILMLKEKKTSP